MPSRQHLGTFQGECNSRAHDPYTGTARMLAAFAVTCAFVIASGIILGAL